MTTTIATWGWRSSTSTCRTDAARGEGADTSASRRAPPSRCTARRGGGGSAAGGRSTRCSPDPSSLQGILGEQLRRHGASEEAAAGSQRDRLAGAAAAPAADETELLDARERVVVERRSHSRYRQRLVEPEAEQQPLAQAH